jgi:hypothetical protein
VRKRPTTDDPEKWLEAFDVSGLCSYRLEDFVSDLLPLTVLDQTLVEKF